MKTRILEVIKISNVESAYKNNLFIISRNFKRKPRNNSFYRSKNIYCLPFIKKICVYILTENVGARRR